MELRVGVVGVGPVGDRIVRVIRERDFPVKGELVVMATHERTEILAGEEFLVKECSDERFEGLNVVFFAGREGAKGASVQWGEVATKAGAWVVDNGGDFRMTPGYPLVVPEVNMAAITGENRHVCSPNCSTIQMVVAIAPIHRAVGIKRIVVSTYQSVSGWGLKAMEELERQVPVCLEQDAEVPFDPSVFTRTSSGTNTRMRSWWGACARITRCRTGSICGAWPTTCARARRLTWCRQPRR